MDLWRRLWRLSLWPLWRRLWRLSLAGLAAVESPVDPYRRGAAAGVTEHRFQTGIKRMEARTGRAELPTGEVL